MKRARATMAARKGWVNGSVRTAAPSVVWSRQLADFVFQHVRRRIDFYRPATRFMHCRVVGAVTCSMHDILLMSVSGADRRPLPLGDAPHSRHRCDIFGRKFQLAENPAKTDRVIRVSFIRSRCLAQVVAQGRRRLTLQWLGQYGLGTVLVEAWCRVQLFQFRMGKRNEHAVGTSAR